MREITLTPFKEKDCHCGELVALEAHKEFPFEIKRVFYIYNVSSEVSRGAHAHKDSNQMLICVAGSCRIVLDDGHTQKEFLLDKPNRALLQPKLVWGEMLQFSADAVLMVLSDSLYDPEDYIHDYAQFQRLAKR